MTPSERLVFAPSVEGLLVRGLGAQLSMEARRELQLLGIDLARPLKPAYPAELWHQGLAVVARHVYPGVAPEDAYFKMGERTVRGLEDHFVGKTMVALAKLVGPRKMLARLPSTVKTGSNFAHLTVTELGPNAYELTSQPYMGYGEFMQGSIYAAILIAGGKEPRVEIAEYDRAAEKLRLHVTWGQPGSTAT
jgi:uncharacterized protein (TIGR02265 family)